MILLDIFDEQKNRTSENTEITQRNCVISLETVENKRNRHDQGAAAYSGSGSQADDDSEQEGAVPFYILHREQFFVYTKAFFVADEEGGEAVRVYLAGFLA